MNHPHQAAQHYPPGRVASSCMLYGAVSMALALAMHLVGLFKQGDVILKQSLAALTSDFYTVVVSDSLLFLVAALFSFGIAFAVLDSPATWRRVVLGLTAFVVLLAMVPVCALWQIYFSPFFVGVAYFWAWFCTMMYASQHVMPCEYHEGGQGPGYRDQLVAAPEAMESKPEEVEEREVEGKVEREACSDQTQKEEAEDLELPDNHSDSKYKPKE